MFGHMVEHLELPIDETFFHFTFFLRGVPIFFVISGYLIWFSIGRSKTYGVYLKKRFWRIYPELWVAVIVELIVLVALYDGWEIKSLLLFLNVKQIFTSYGKESFTLFGKQFFTLPGKEKFTLPGKEFFTTLSGSRQASVR